LFSIFAPQIFILMKNLTILSILLFAATVSYSQKKGDLEIQVAEQSKAIDSLNTQLNNLNTEFDSTSIELKEFKGMHDAIAERVINYDFDPSRMDVLIDSLRNSRDSTFSASTKFWQDSVDVLIEHIRLLGTLPIDSAAIDEGTDLDAITSGNAAIEAANTKPSKDDMMKELEMLKDLLDQGILTEEEFSDRKKKVIADW